MESQLQRGWGQAERAAKGTFTPILRSHARPVAPTGDNFLSTEWLAQSAGFTLAILPKDHHNLFFSEQET